MLGLILEDIFGFKLDEIKGFLLDEMFGFRRLEIFGFRLLLMKGFFDDAVEGLRLDGMFICFLLLSNARVERHVV